MASTEWDKNIDNSQNMCIKICQDGNGTGVINSLNGIENGNQNASIKWKILMMFEWKTTSHTKMHWFQQNLTTQDTQSSLKA